MEKTPLVSIIIPVYNGSNYLESAIFSALDQDYPNFEVVVVNDGSKDQGKTEKIAKSFGKKIRYFSKPNGGVASALNLAIEKARGEYVSWLSHDDLYYPNKLSVQVKFLGSQTNENVVLYSDFEYLDGNSKYLRTVKMPPVLPENFRMKITTHSFMHGCTMLIPKKCFKEFGKFDEKLKTVQDYDFWFKIADNYRFTYCPGVLVKSRLHNQQGTVTMKDTVLREVDDLYTSFVQKLTPRNVKNFFPVKPLFFFLIKAYVAYRKQGYQKAAAAALKRAIQIIW